MNSAKYVVMGEDHESGIEKIFIFPGTINHDRFAKGMKRVTRMPIVVSAGFVSEFMTCYGESRTLNLKSRPEKDTFLLKMMLEIDDKRIEVY